jgi:Zn-dependent protease
MHPRAHFHILGFPVRVELWFWLTAAFWAFRYDSTELIISWIVVVFVSVLVHELGHALALRYFSQPSAIVLHGFGGVTISPRRLESRRQSIIVSLAGSVTAFSLLGVPSYLLWRTDWLASQTNVYLLAFVFFSKFVNIWWSIINLLPIRPLDGGNIATDLFGLPAARRISVVAAGALAVFAWTNGQRYAAFFAIFLGVMNAIEIRSESGGTRMLAFHVDGPDPEDSGGGGTTRGRGRSKRAKARSHLQPVPPLSQMGGTANRGDAEAKAWGALRDGHAPAALAAIEPFAKDSGLDPYLRASVALASGRSDLADELFERAYTANPSGPPNLVAATLLAEHGRAVAVAHRLVAKGTVGTDAAGSLQTHLHYSDRFREAAEVGELVFSAQPASPAQTAFETACSWAKAGRGDEAVRWVETAIDAGFTAGRMLDGEPDLDAARAEPGWAAVRARADAQS